VHAQTELLEDTVFREIGAQALDGIVGGLCAEWRNGVLKMMLTVRKAEILRRLWNWLILLRLIALEQSLRSAYSMHHNLLKAKR